MSDQIRTTLEQIAKEASMRGGAWAAGVARVALIQSNAIRNAESDKEDSKWHS